MKRKERKTQISEEYKNSPVIPLTMASYNKVVVLLYKERIFKPKYLILYSLLWSPFYFFASLALETNLAIMMTLSTFIFLLTIFPPALVYFLFLLAKINKGPRLHKYGPLKNL